MIETLKNFGGKKLGGLILIVVIVLRLDLEVLEEGLALIIKTILLRLIKQM